MGAYSPYRLRFLLQFYGELADGVVPPMTEEAEVPRTTQPMLEAAPWEHAACLHADVDRALAHLGGPATSVAYAVLVRATGSRTALDGVLLRALKPLPFPRAVVESAFVLGWDDLWIERQWHLRHGTVRPAKHEALGRMARFLGEEPSRTPVAADVIHQAARAAVAQALAAHDAKFGVVDAEPQALARCG